MIFVNKNVMLAKYYILQDFTDVLTWGIHILKCLLNDDKINMQQNISRHILCNGAEAQKTIAQLQWLVGWLERKIAKNPKK
jgi:hypothetical protein